MTSKIPLIFCILLGCGAPHVEVIRMPDMMRAGEKSIIAFEMTGGKETDVLDVTFTGDRNIAVTIDNGSDRWDKVYVYPPGAEIWHKTFGKMQARNLLVSSESASWKGEKKLVLNVTPSRKGEVGICVGGAFVTPSRKETRYAQESKHINQQGHPCTSYEITVR